MQVIKESSQNGLNALSFKSKPTSGIWVALAIGWMLYFNDYNLTAMCVFLSTLPFSSYNLYLAVKKSA